ncbi:MAG: ComEC/Rec2 family competence protein [Lachnospiraceae bacterium]|nr:ComEC/Rec2 family competence protein [Lachnospiraceae bacterium]
MKRQVNLLGIIKDLFPRPLVLIMISLILGIMTGDLSNTVIKLLLIVLGILYVLLITAAIYKAENDKKKNRRKLILGFILFSYLIGLIQIKDYKTDSVSGYTPDSSKKETAITGEVSDILISADKYLITITNPKVKLKNVEITYDEGDMNILVYADTIPDYSIGDKINAIGTLYPFTVATNYGQFDQKKYYNTKGYICKLYADEIVALEKNETIRGTIRSALFDASLLFKDALSKVFYEENKGTLTAMLTGDKAELDEDTKEIFQRIGIAHILSISGLHITLLGMGLFNILMLLLKKIRLCSLLTIIIIYLYGVFTGFSVSTQRAVIMIFCMLLARMLLRAYDGQSAAALAACIILVKNPTELYDTGFLLSFTAVFGIFAGNRIRKNLQIENPVLIYCIPGFFAQLATFPVILRTYYSFSPYTFLANMILLPFMSVIVMSGLVAGIFGCIYLLSGTGIFLNIGIIAGGPANYLLKAYGAVSEWLLSLPGADIITGCPGVVQCFAYYLMFFCCVYISGKAGRFIKKDHKAYTDDRKIGLSGAFTKHYKELLTAGTGAVIIVMFVVLTFKTGRNKLYTAFLDVGQGLCVYTETEDMVILADGGSSNVKNVGKYRIEPFLLYRGISEIDICFITHTDTDHTSGIKELLKDGRIKIKNMVLGINNSENEPLIILAREKGVNVIYAKTGDVFEGDISADAISNNIIFDDKKEEKYDKNMKMKILSPDLGFIYEDKNQASLVILLDYEDMRMLLPGDSDLFAESEYIRYIDEKNVDVMQSPHHGSKYSGSELLLEKTRPTVTVISCSKTNVYGHPAKETLERLENIGSKYYITAHSGMIGIKYDGNGKYIVIPYLKDIDKIVN